MSNMVREASAHLKLIDPRNTDYNESLADSKSSVDWFQSIGDFLEECTGKEFYQQLATDVRKGFKTFCDVRIQKLVI